jgi:carboxyl-terminal processing protease
MKRRDPKLSSLAAKPEERTFSAPATRSLAAIRAFAGTMTMALLLGCSAPDSTLVQFSQVSSEQMLRAGFSDIQQIYIDEPKVADLAIAGLRGLRKIDPDVDIIRKSDLVSIRRGDSVAGFAHMPKDNDPYAWATIVSKLMDDGRKLSPKLGQARTEEIYTALFDSLATNLDPYSRYSGADEAQENRASRDGFGGIGVTIVPHTDGVEITEVVSGLPADRAGLQRGDRILSINGHGISSYGLRRIARLLQGPVGRSVELAVRRKNNPASLQMSVPRTHITPQSVFYRLEEDVAVIEISSFNSETASSVAQSVFRARHQKGVNLRGLVLDLRDNPGGLLHQAVRIADLFIEQGRIVSTRGRHRDSLQYFDATPGDIANNLPMAVLLNGYSASAAEILAAALQDNKRAILIGTTSYGKGTVQTVLRMPNDGELVLTWARLYAPSGYSMNGLGVVPTICTTKKGSAENLVQRALAAESSPSHQMLSIRRTYQKASVADRKLLTSYCPAAASRQGNMDLKVARMLLTVQKSYMRTIHLARTANGL